MIFDGSASQRRATKKMVVLYIVLYPMLFSSLPSQLQGVQKSISRDIELSEIRQYAAYYSHRNCSKLPAPLISWKLGDVSTESGKKKPPPAKGYKIHARLARHTTGEEIEKVKSKRRDESRRVDNVASRCHFES